MSEVAHAFRRLLSVRAFSIAVIVTVATTVGANGAIFSAVRGLLVKPLPIAGADQLVWIFGNREGGREADRSAVNDYEAEALRHDARVFRQVAVIGDRSLVRHVGSARSRWHGLWITPSLFDVLQVVPAAGQPITIHHARAGTTVMMISHERWTKDLGGDSSIIGRSLHFVDGKTFIVAGVLPPGLRFPFGRSPRGGNGSGYQLGVQDFWILGQQGDRLPGGTVIARLQPGINVAAATDAARAALTATAGSASEANSGRRIEVISMRTQALGLVQAGLRMAQAFALLMLVLAVANLANLTLLRLRGRFHEMAVRRALGAASSEIIRSVVIESVLLSCVGGGIGFAFAAAARPVLRALSADTMPMLDAIQVDWVVGIFTFGAALFVGALVAAIAAIVVTRIDPRAALGAGRGQTMSRAGRRLATMLVVSQVALAFTLSVSAGLITRSFAHLMGEDTGYHPEGVISADIEVFDHGRVADYYEELHRRLKSLPGVDAVGLIHSTPLTGKWTFDELFEVAGQSYPTGRAPRVAGSFVGFDYFEAMRIPFVSGRPFTTAEARAGNPPVLIINETAARRFFPDGDAVGRIVTVGKPRRIVGVVKDSRDVRLDSPAEPMWYEAGFGHGNQLIVRTHGESKVMLEQIREALVASDPGLVIERIGYFSDIVASTVADRRMAMRLLSVLAAFALALASLGLYGLLSFSVKQRVREFGVRSALGASPDSLMRHVVAGGMRLAAVGIALGLPLSIGGAQILRGLLYKIGPTDPSTTGLVAGVLVAVALIASAVPAWTASRVDAAITLREE